MTLGEALQKQEFAITCEFVPGRASSGPGVDAAVVFAREVKASGLGVHAVSLTDNPGGTPAIMPDVIGVEVQREGVDALVHFSCRDMNRNAIESRALALARGGIRNILVITGDHTGRQAGGRAAPVFDLGSVQAIRHLKAISNGLEVPGTKPGTTIRLPPANFLIGGAVSPFKLTEAELMLQFFKLEKKIAAGADFIITQLGYDMRKFFEVKRYLACRGLNVPLIGNVYVLSLGAAKAMAANKVPGCVVTEALVQVLEQESAAPDKGKAARLERAARMVAAFKGMGFAGVHIGGFGLKFEDFRTIIERAAALASEWEACVADVQFGRAEEFYAFPKPECYTIETPDADPVATGGEAAMPMGYALSRRMHDVMFDPKSPVYKVMQTYFKKIGDKGVLARGTHGFEWWVKRMLYDCRDCGDCALADTGFCCTMAHCAKQQRDGPCGGSCEGMCEVYPTERPCVWTQVYKRLKSAGEADKLRSTHVPPRKTELQHTSGWANYYLGRDHSAGDRASSGDPSPSH